MPAEIIREVLLDRSINYDPSGMQLRGLRITGKLNLDHVSLTCRVTFDQCHFDEIPTFEQAKIPSLSLTACELPGISLAFTRIDGELKMRGAQFYGEVGARGISVGGQLSMGGATITNPKARALNLDAANIDGDVLLDEGFKATGSVHGFGLRVAGMLSMKGAILFDADGTALTLDRATVSGSVFLGNGFKAVGKVRAVGISVAGQFSMKAATLDNGSSDALSLDNASIGGSLFLSNGFKATGRVRAVGIRVVGQVSLKDATFVNRNGLTYALDLDQANIGRDVFMVDNFNAEGGVTAEGIVVGGQLNLKDAVFSRPKGAAFNLERGNIESLSLDDKSKFIGGLAFLFTTIQKLSVGPTRPSGGLPRLTSVRGWKIGAMDGFLLTDCKSAANWLDTVPVQWHGQREHQFATQPWLELARNYDQAGRPDLGRWLRFAAAKRSTRAAPWTSKISRWMYGATVGYGYFPGFVLIWVALLWAVVFALASTNLSSFTPTSPDAMNSVVTHVDGRSELIANTGAS
ncbi:MAG: hypothetical protein ABI072_02625, partial [Edaphobacter sp.]